MAGSLRHIGLTAALAVLGISATGCAADVTFANLSDEQMGDLFPTASEVVEAFGASIELGEPGLVQPVTASEAARASPTLDPGVPEDCREVFLGSDETKSLEKTRQFRMDGGSTEPSRLYSWNLRQHPSAAEANRFVETYESAYAKCSLVQIFDLEVTKGFGDSLVSDGADVSSSGAIAVGDVTMTFGLTGKTQDETEAAVKKMAVVVERRLQASGK